LNESESQSQNKERIDISSLTMTFINTFILIMIITISKNNLLNLSIILIGYGAIIFYILYLIKNRNPFNQYPLIGFIISIMLNLFLTIDFFSLNNITMTIFSLIIFLEIIFLIDVFIGYYHGNIARKMFYAKFGQRYGYGMKRIGQFWYDKDPELKIKLKESNLIKDLREKYGANKILLVSLGLTLIEILLLLIFH